MALNSSVKVSLPEHGIAYKKVSGKTYVYYVTASYRNEKGQPTCDRSSIGRLDEESGMLIPNRNYYEIYLKTPSPTATGIFSSGVNYAFEGIADKLGLSKLLKLYFPESCKEILTTAQYMLSEGNVMYYLDDYTESHKTALNECMGSAKSSRLFSSVRQENMLLFFREWMKHKYPKEYVAYDVTSISSYGKTIDELEWGYNRDKERLPQINMGMYYGEESGLPLYYRVYPGSISDKAHLRYMVADNEFINGKKTSFVMDRGFYSADNLQYLTENGYRFVTALPGSLKYCSDLIKRHRAELVNHSEHMLGKGLPYGKAYEVTELGFRMNVHLYYDADKALQENEALYELIERQENDLKSMEEPPDRKLKYDRYFFINRSKDGKLGFTRNHKAIDEQLERCGFFLIAETDFRKTTAEILEIYRRRDVIEKSFDNLKNELDMKRLRSHNSETVRGKLFVSFISLIVQSYMLKHLSFYMQTTGCTFRKILLELDKIKCFDLNTKAKPRLLNPVSKSQRDIFLALDLPQPHLSV
ncbi:MAG TPA: transposase [Oscillospiraceae bacterium]|nr:transposase [Oscillospiraceae bacterium]